MFKPKNVTKLISILTPFFTIQKLTKNTFLSKKGIFDENMENGKIVTYIFYS